MVYKKVKELREFKGLKQDEMANLLNITRSAYSAYEIGKRQMSHESLCLLADFFEVTTDYLLGRGQQDLFMLTEQEKGIIEKYRKLDERSKQTVSGVLDMEYERLEPKKDIKKGVG